MLNDDRFILESKAVAERLGEKGLEVKRFQVPPEVPFAGALKDDNRGAIVGAAHTVVEFGHPITTSFCLGLMTERKDLIAEDQVSIAGKELKELPRGLSVALIILAQVAKRSLLYQNPANRRRLPEDSTPHPAVENQQRKTVTDGAHPTVPTRR
jgi:hypothetical protein